MRKSRILNFSFAFLFPLFAFSGCHTSAPDSGFLLQPELLKANENLPFDAVWFKSNLDLKKYSKVMVAAINTDHMLKMSWWDKLSFAETTEKLDPQHEVKFLAVYFRDNLVRTFSESPGNKLAIVAKPDRNTLIVELAIVEVVPTKIWLNSFSYLIAGALDTGTTAIEGRFRDGKTNEVIFRFKDKRAGPYSLVNVGDFTWYSHAKDTISNWSKMIVATCNRNPNETVSSPVNFTLLPW